MDDQSTQVQQLKQVVREFVDERDWRQFHTPKNLTMAMSIEAAELMEHFQWLTPEQSGTIDEPTKLEVAEEMADVFCYLLAIANELDIDLSDALVRKMVKNRLKYPTEEYKGRYGPKDQP